MSEQQQKKAPATGAATAVIADPKPVKLNRTKEPNGQLADAVPVAPVATAAPVPRLIHDNERAPAGLRRWAIRCLRPLKPKRYVLARSKEEAESYYRQYAGLASEALVVVAMND